MMQRGDTRWVRSALPNGRPITPSLTLRVSVLWKIPTKTTPTRSVSEGVPTHWAKPVRSIASLVLLFTCVPWSSGCSSKPAPSKGSSPTPPSIAVVERPSDENRGTRVAAELTPNQGLMGDERDRFYHLD